MCGIWALFGITRPSAAEIAICLKELNARGPEYTAIEDYGSVVLGFTRLAINGLTPRGHQPIDDKQIAVVCNGELYNYRELAQRWSIPLPEGCSDCEVLPTLLRNLEPTEVCRALDGVFAFVAYDKTNNTVTVARDPYGVRPLFMGMGDGFQVFASEIKALTPICHTVKAFPPGTYYKFTLPQPGSTQVEVDAFGYHAIPWLKNPAFDDEDSAASALKVALESAVAKRLMSDRPIGALLSGGLDSSLVCALAAKTLKAQGRKLNTFSIGMPGSTDLHYAQLVADKIGSVHHAIELKPDEFFGAIKEVIAAAETYDITSVRASVGNYLVGRYIKANTDIKVVFNGDGSDEAGGGYLYFYRAPSDETFEAETTRLLKDIYAFDVLRSDRSMAAHGLEARTPFLDRQLVAVWKSLPTALRRPTPAKKEKYILRKAFDADDLLPNDVLWRKKEAFSDGVSATEKPWHASINEWARTQIPNVAEELKKAATKYPHNTPKTPEALLYRRVFEELYGQTSASIIPYFWMPKWSPETTDPSARTLSLY
jgi:asparagine synthase (glutamine-hydrolysing)